MDKKGDLDKYLKLEFLQVETDMTRDENKRSTYTSIPTKTCTIDDFCEGDMCTDELRKKYESFSVKSQTLICPSTKDFTIRGNASS